MVSNIYLILFFVYLMFLQCWIAKGVYNVQLIDFMDILVSFQAKKLLWKSKFIPSFRIKSWPKMLITSRAGYMR